VLRPHDHINFRHPLQQLLALLLRHAPRDGNEHILFAASLRFREGAERVVELLLGVVTNAARVDDDNVNG
jgi:hypothetical protein